MSVPVFILSPHASIRQDAQQLLVETPTATFAFGYRQPERLRGALYAFAHGSSVRGAAGNAFTVNQIAPIVDALAGDGLAELTPLLVARTADDWLSAYFAICDTWALEIFTSEFWAAVLSGEASTGLVLGWAIEFYHRTVGADEHNELAVRHCRDPFVKVALEEHFREECGHGEMFLRGLTACNVPRIAVTGSTPLPTTRGLIEYMNGLAKSDSVAYLGCYGVLHAPRHGQTPEQVKTQFTRLARLYPAAAGAIRSMQEHAVLDLSLGHDQIELERYVRARGIPSLQITLRIINAARGMAMAFNRFFEGIHTHYHDRPAGVPTVR